MSNNILEVKQLIKKYNNFSAVKGISFNLAEGETLAILGPNGAGKSTTLKMIYATTPITSGQVLINGINVAQNARRSKWEIGVVMQEDLLDTTLTVLDNMIAHAILFDIPFKVARERGITLLNFVGLDNYWNKQVYSLSGGMRRRLVLARALVNNPKLIILDEPTTGLDIQSRHVFWAKLNELKLQGVSILLTSHYVDEIETLADKILMIDHGKIIANGYVKTLAKDLGYENLETAYLKLTNFDEEARNIEQTRS
ncbi:ABC transporter ATP-binding protein [Leuconostoc gasicomitatum]|uniref:ABC transporter ATP-binding protein n=1 Tax=Leuconostoc gasicomitatum TaxID=115778 RepID=UPI001CC77485|nr:ABC transporter ATP-binding protein [Leuconostoc gasicomitatum]MBZ5969354.1 ABC transporter ATP-binding protein [Leuconostoc gasicomitatum]MBZ5997886.1 ABC transporter ATP-binding protein [Leuconostoc gasicomitatum]